MTDFVIPREEDSAEFRVVLNPGFADGDTAVVGPTDRHSVSLLRQHSDKNSKCCSILVKHAVLAIQLAFFCCGQCTS